ncbi:energy-coupling factor transporter transmembrane component T family protein [Infirmifilum sp.]|jgi:energy-coupling factor transport system permease protein|uniref:energy-coupling factor transporter transmembrane component T family protein n=1 Tax=Infirmifilum sp. TaxID=2856575 RepID=UPI003D0D00D6
MPRIFEYEYKPTFIHSLSPLTKLLLLVIFFTLTTLYWDPFYLMLLTIIAVIMYILAKAPLKWLLLTIPFGTYRFIEAGIISYTLSKPEYFRVTPHELVTQKIFELGPLVYTYGSFLWALGYISKIFVTLTVTFLFIYTTPLNGLISTLYYLRVPRVVTYILTLGLRFVPDILRETEMLARAQSLRGWELKASNPISLAKRSKPFVLPYTSRIISYVDILTLTLQIRGFGAVRESRWRAKITLTKNDLATILIALTLFIIALYYYSRGYGII